MSDIGDIGDAPEPVSDTVSRAEYDRLAADHIRERNLYKPYAQAFRGMGEAERSAILNLAGHVRSGDMDGVVDWSLSTMENLTGKTAADIIAARQAATPVGQTVAPEQAPAGPTPQQIAEMVNQQVSQQISTQRMVDSMSATMNAAGFEPSSPSGRAIITIARDLDMEPTAALQQAISMFTTDVIARAQQGQAAVAAAAAAVPGTAPTGAPLGAVPADGLSGRQRAMARLSATAS